MNLESVHHHRLPLPQTAASRDSFKAAMERGYADEDMASVIMALESLTNI